MNSRLLQVFLISFLLIIAQYSEGQSIRVRGAATKYTRFQIPGRVRMEKGDPSGAVVNLINLDSKQIEKSITVPSSGKFDLELSYFKEYKMSISKDGFYDKDINVSTVIPRNIWDQDSIFPPYAIVVTLYKKVPGIQLSFEGKIIGKVSYSPNGTLDNFDSNIFIDDQTIQEEIDNAVRNIGDKDFNQKVAQALEYEKKNELSTAYTLYTEASKIKPSDKFVREKLKELASDLKNLVNQAKLQAEFNRLIAQGDVYITGLNYSAAIQNFKNALKVIPNDPIGLSRLSDAERLLALAGEKAKQDAEKQLALDREKAKADADKLLALAAEKAKQDADKQLALDREKAKADADKLLALAAEKAKQDAEKQLALDREKAKADADKLLALAAEKAKQDAEKQLALDREKAKADADKLLALAAEKAKQDAEKQLALEREKAKADAEKQLALEREKAKAEADKLLALAAEKAKQDAEKQLALEREKAKADAEKQLALEREKAKAEADKLLALAAEKVRKDAEFKESEKLKSYNEAMAQGASYSSAKQFTDAINAYRAAQKILPSEVLPARKIMEIQAVIDALAAKALADQKSAEDSKLSKEEKLFLEKIKLADENFKNLQWSVARFYYVEALKIKQSDNYSLEKVGACDKMIDSGMTAEKLQEYKNKITSGDDQMKAKNYVSARFYYRGASDILTWEAYPKKQLNEIDSLVAKNLNLSDQKIFSENRIKGDDAFLRKEYATARFFYNKAIEISQNDHIASRLIEIESILNGSETKKTDADYAYYIKKGDEARNQKNSAIARFYFQKAISLKPDENYPKQELGKINSGSFNP